MNKNDARRKGLDNRDALPVKERDAKSRNIYCQLLPLIDQADVVGCYVSMRTEVDTTKILDHCFASGIPVCVPKVTGSTLEFIRISSREDLRDGVFGTMEPVTGEIVDPKHIDLMICPLSAYDEAGNRTGYGKGYYDSILNDVPFKVGIAFREQEMDHIECDESDVPLDRVISA